MEEKPDTSARDVDDVPAPDGRFGATLDTHGLYETNHFVLRLSPRNHELVDELTGGDIEVRNASPEALRAYAVYLHETVHWWQHVGSTSGLIYSLVYPAQTYSTQAQAREVLQAIGPVKPIKAWAETAQREGKPVTDRTLQLANVAVNNAVDVDFYRRITASPAALERVFQDRYFESVGHCYFVAYGQILGLIAEAVDKEFEELPFGASWDAEYYRVREARSLGFYHGSPMVRADVGLHALYEGQARFIQLQFLVRAGVEPNSMAELKSRGFFEGIYVEAFEAFLERAASTPSTKGRRASSSSSSWFARALSRIPWPNSSPADSSKGSTSRHSKLSWSARPSTGRSSSKTQSSRSSSSSSTSRSIPRAASRSI